jgi:hypothetical protein
MGDARSRPVRHQWRVPLFGLFLLGLALRLGGLPFSGITDLYQMLLEWGAAVSREGLAKAFAVNYGILSYAAFGLATTLGEGVPRFWWMPYKLIVLAFDVGVLLLLLRLVTPERRPLVLCLYWLNPWFILHEAYHGFWEAPHILFGLLAVLAGVATRRSRRAWAAVGALLVCSAWFKPQGLLHFAAPLGGYLGVQVLRGVRAPLSWCAAGMVAVIGLTSVWLWAAGGSAFGLVDNYRSAFTTMSGISNGGPGIWQFFSFVYMNLTGQTGHVAWVRMPRITLAVLTGLAGAVCLLTVLAFALQVAIRNRNDGPVEDGGLRWTGLPRPIVTGEPSYVMLLVLTLGALVVSQFGARAHINHSYTAMVLLVPLAAGSGEIRRLWLAMNVLLGVVHLSTFKLGPPALLPPEDILHRYSAAENLVGQVVALPAYHRPDGPLVVQRWLNDLLAFLPGTTGLSLLSPVVFLLACLLVVQLFRAAVKPAPSITSEAAPQTDERKPSR